MMQRGDVGRGWKEGCQRSVCVRLHVKQSDDCKDEKRCTSLSNSLHLSVSLSSAERSVLASKRSCRWKERLYRTFINKRAHSLMCTTTLDSKY